ncbi:GreA/GreB family elongation factor [Microcella sp.]|uniref:GreA/GreB family elongation factor n=1 Tax=Microcella sp. TaxID=1913979 RepID=UPI003F71B7E5
MAAETIWMTQAARQKLETELAELDRAAPADGPSLARAIELRALLRSAVVDRKPDDGLVEPGMLVTVRFATDGSESTFLLGSRALSGLDSSLDLDVYSPTSPLGAAISNRHVGDTVIFAAPSGEQRITIVSAAPFG